MVAQEPLRDALEVAKQQLTLGQTSTSISLPTFPLHLDDFLSELMNRIESPDWTVTRLEVVVLRRIRPSEDLSLEIGDSLASATTPNLLLSAGMVSMPLVA